MSQVYPPNHVITSLTLWNSWFQRWKDLKSTNHWDCSSSWPMKTVNVRSGKVWECQLTRPYWATETVDLRVVRISRVPTKKTDLVDLWRQLMWELEMYQCQLTWLITLLNSRTSRVEKWKCRKVPTNETYVIVVPWKQLLWELQMSQSTN